MRTGIWLQHPELLQSANDHGVIRVADLTAMGVSSKMIRARTRRGGPWQRLLPGVVLLSNGTPTQRERELAALAYAGPDAVVTGRAALGEHGHRVAQGDVHVLIPERRRVASAGFVVVERTTRLPTAVVKNGVPCAPVARALLDTARRCDTVDAVRALISAVVQRGSVTVDTLKRELAEGSRRGVSLVREVLAEVTDGVASVPEAKARKLWQSSGLPAMVFNKPLVDENGRFVARPDGWIDSVGLVWEIDSLEWHLSPADYLATVKRRTLLQAKGAVVLVTVPKQLRTDPDAVLADLRSHYAQAAARSRRQVSLTLSDAPPRAAASP